MQYLKFQKCQHYIAKENALNEEEDIREGSYN